MNINTTPQSLPIEQQPQAPTPRRRGRPPGSKNKTHIEFGKGRWTSRINVSDLRQTLPPMPTVSDAAFAEDLEITLNNTSFRLSASSKGELEVAKWLIWFDKQCGVPKAQLVRECLLRYLPIICRERIQAAKSADGWLPNGPFQQ